SEASAKDQPVIATAAEFQKTNLRSGPMIAMPSRVPEAISAARAIPSEENSGGSTPLAPRREQFEDLVSDRLRGAADVREDDQRVAGGRYAEDRARTDIVAGKDAGRETRRCLRGRRRDDHEPLQGLRLHEHAGRKRLVEREQVGRCRVRSAGRRPA